MNNNVNNANGLTIIGYNPQTGEPIYSSNNQENCQNVLPSYQLNNNSQLKSVIYASFGERFVAALVDYLKMLLCGFGVFMSISLIKLLLSINDFDNDILNLFLSFIQIPVPVIFGVWGQPIYALFADASKKHATKAKLKRNIYVVNKNGNYLSFGESLLRALLKIITLFIPFGVIATLIVMGCTEKKQALHDIILNQYVVKK